MSVDQREYVDLVRRTWGHAGAHPDAVAVRQGRDEWTYSDVVRAASRHVRDLRAAGVTAGDRVLLVAPTGVAFVQAYLGILAAGAVVVPVNPLCTTRELEHFARDADVCMVIAWHDDATSTCEVAATLTVPFVELREIAPGARDDVADVEARPVEDTAALLYTSGTTGVPKGAIITFGNIFASTSAVRHVFELSADDRLGTALPLFHVYGQVAVLGAALDVGASVSLLQRFAADTMLRMVEVDELTVLSGVPTMWIEMLESARHLDPAPSITSLRVASSGGATLPTEVNRAFASEFGATVQSGYALSETTAIGACEHSGRESREGSVGQAVSGVEISVVDDHGDPVPVGTVGEVTIAGANVTPGYWRRPEATAEALAGGRLLTGDLGRMDEDGYLWIVGRKKELIIRGGYNVYPREVEDALYEHPAVLEAAVVGVPDDRLGEEVAAVVSFRSSSSASPAELRAWLDERIAAYKVPRLIQVVPTLPKGATGKIQKTAIDRDVVRDLGTRVRRSPAQ
ncbi:AMP-binding protein [Aeromicrobium endophyticum]|uniref:AMP-dependent synthetase n=1 Tax=Aeromicrobium endophyticum TaxID=2292704 RepID=A0A371PAC5_9ACTN|nr:AMP-binding protein [Aeromicrobium endophyticum]REK72904.1 AMP-dependent synthetase [Aeromicrobium endophyticum]